MRTKQEYEDVLFLIKRILRINLNGYNYELTEPYIIILQELIDNYKEKE